MEGIISYKVMRVSLLKTWSLFFHLLILCFLVYIKRKMQNKVLLLISTRLWLVFWDSSRSFLLFTGFCNWIYIFSHALEFVTLVFVNKGTDNGTLVKSNVDVIFLDDYDSFKLLAHFSYYYDDREYCDCRYINSSNKLLGILYVLSFVETCFVWKILKKNKLETLSEDSKSSFYVAQEKNVIMVVDWYVLLLFQRSCFLMAIVFGVIDSF